MSKRNRLQDSTVIGGLIAALAIVAVVLYAVNKPNQHQYAREVAASQDRAANRTMIGAKELEQTNWGRPECSKPQSKDEADLCQQARMAEAAERTVTLSQIQLILGIIGAGLLFWNLHYARQATLAAVGAVQEARKSAAAAIDGVKVAERQADLAEQSFRGVHRPYILPGGIVIAVPAAVDSLKNPEVRFSIGNYGPMPGIIHYVDAIFSHDPLNVDIGVEVGISRMGRNFNSGEIISANTVRDNPMIFPISGHISIDRKRKGLHLAYREKEKASVFLIIYTKFEDPFGIVRRGRFTWRYDNNFYRFVRHGGDQCNHEREEEWGAG